MQIGNLWVSGHDQDPWDLRNTIAGTHSTIEAKRKSQNQGAEDNTAESILPVQTKGDSSRNLLPTADDNNILCESVSVVPAQSNEPTRGPVKSPDTDQVRNDTWVTKLVAHP
jgi:hypothetical protein